MSVEAELEESVSYTPIQRMRHSAAHVMAEAVLEIFPDAKLAIGPAIEDGFYYDFDLPRALTPGDLPEIERRMARIIAGKYPFLQERWPREKALQYFRDRGQIYKVELIENLPDEEVGIYRQDTFLDLCRGPHVENTGQIGPFKLMRVAGAYWRGDEHRPMLQRIYGTAWFTQEELDHYLWRLDEARKRDHRTLGKSLDLYSTSEAVGPGLILWHPRGAMVRFLAERFSQEAHLYNGYEWVYTPHIGRAGLWRTSGHLDFFRENMYPPLDIEGEEYYVKPMNCPFHIEIFKSRPRSYKELPKRYAEYGTVYRYERSGVLHGLTRVRGFTQDDAHTFCRPDQVEDEVRHALQFSLYILRTFGLENFKGYISTRPEKAVGSLEDWEMATTALKRIAAHVGLSYDIEEGGGAFYGPKIDLKVMDLLGREWQLSTIQFDFNLPERFGLAYIGEDGQPHRPYMVHRALFGSAERFFGMLIEHYGGAFPLWLAPEQAVIVPIADRNKPYAHEVAQNLRAAGMRIVVDEGEDRMQAKIRNAEMQKVPYVLVVGGKEEQAKTIAVRSHKEGDLGPMTVEGFLEVTRTDRLRGIPRPLSGQVVSSALEEQVTRNRVRGLPDLQREHPTHPDQ
jgi:threonyl-tRNA synthetase